MTSRKAIPWYQNLQIIAWSAGGLTAAGALIVGTAKYINLPHEVEAAVKKNELQDEAIIELKKSNEIWQDIYQQQQQAPSQAMPRPTYRYWTDDAGTCWRCDIRYDCEQDGNWSRCD